MKTFFCSLFLLLAFVGAAQNRATKQPPNSVCVPNAPIQKNKKMENISKRNEKNVLGSPLRIAGTKPMTGYYRDGFCSTGDGDTGVHVVAAVVTDEFLQYSKSQGNDLITPLTAYGFPGLKAGDTWCLCAARWKEAFDAGAAPPVLLEATHEKALRYATLEELKSKAKK